MVLCLVRAELGYAMFTWVSQVVRVALDCAQRRKIKLTEFVSKSP